MTNRESGSVKFAAVAVLAMLYVTSVGAGPSIAAARTLAEFKEYAVGKLPAITGAQLEQFAKMVDKDGDGAISDAEFNDRLAVLQKFKQGGGEPAPAKPPSGKESSKRPSDAPNAELAIVPEFTNTGKATILLITGDEIATAWEPFAEWKTRNGKATKIVTVGRIEKEYEADCVQEKIRLCVRDHIDNHGTRWVILGGDCQPGDKGLVPGGHTTIHAQEGAGIPTDIVYLSNTDWDADGDGVYGEWEDDRETINYPDGTVGLGRIPLRTAADVAAFTDKVIGYESEYPTSDFAKQMIYTCTDSPAYPKVRKSWDGYTSRGHILRFLECLKTQCEQRVERGLVVRMCSGQTIRDGR